MKPVWIPVGVLLVPALLLVGCAPSFDRLIFEHTELDQNFERILSDVPEGDDSASAMPVDESPDTWLLHPGGSLHIPVYYEGGSIDQINLRFGVGQYFQIDVETESETESETAEISKVDITGTLSSDLDLPDADLLQYAYQVRGRDGVTSSVLEAVGSFIVCTQDGDCLPDDCSACEGIGGGSGGDGTGTEDGNVSYGDWLFVQSDKALQSRMALVRTEGDTHYVRVQYRIAGDDPIHCTSSECEGYILHAQMVQPEKEWHLYFPNSFIGSIYTLPDVLPIELDGESSRWSADKSRPVSIDPDGSERVILLPAECADTKIAGSTTFRCPGYIWTGTPVTE